MGGDFNLIRFDHEKSKGILHRSLIFKFNNMINLLCLHELHRCGGRFTWTNKRVDPTLEVLDRVLVSASWEALFPLATLMSINMVGSDHSPLILDLGESTVLAPKPFHMEPTWFENSEFKGKILDKWPVRRHGYVLDYWKHRQSELRKIMKGWAANLRGEVRRRKKQLMLDIQEIDDLGDLGNIDADVWTRRYKMDKELARLLADKESYWHRRGVSNGC